MYIVYKPSVPFIVYNLCVVAVLCCALRPRVGAQGRAQEDELDREAQARGGGEPRQGEAPGRDQEEAARGEAQGGGQREIARALRRGVELCSVYCGRVEQLVLLCVLRSPARHHARRGYTFFQHLVFSTHSCELVIYTPSVVLFLAQ